MHGQLAKDLPVEFIFGDIRSFSRDVKVDIVLSELLGSFGDNELAPECLNHTLPFLKPTGFMIPQNCSNALEPVYYPKSQRLIMQSATPSLILNSPHIVYTRAAKGAAPLEAAISYDFTKHSDSMKCSCITWSISKTTFIDGFMGYFTSTLYKCPQDTLHIYLTNQPRVDGNPAHDCKEPTSWFPIYFPINRILVKAGDTLKVELARLPKNNIIWYEWRVREPIETKWYNKNGEAFKMYL